MKNKVIVTGGAGYIGIHTIVDLVENNYEPIIIDNFSNSSFKNILGAEKILNSKLKVYNIDCTQEEQVKEVFEIEKNIVSVIHFAAFKSVEESVKNPVKYKKNNIGSLQVMLNLCVKYNVKKFIFSSSCTVYGETNNQPVSEKIPFGKAQSPYAETKQTCEHILANHSINSISLRYFNPVGSHYSGLIGDRSKDQPSNLIPIITGVAIGKYEKLNVYGGDYNTPDGSCIRDYIHVTDLAKSHIKALKYLHENNGKHIFNIGTGMGYSVLEVINAFNNANNLNIRYEITSRRDGDIEQIYADSSLAKKELNWDAKITIEKAMKDAWNWELNK